MDGWAMDESKTETPVRESEGERNATLYLPYAEVDLREVFGGDVLEGDQQRTVVSLGGVPVTFNVMSQASVRLESPSS